MDEELRMKLADLGSPERLADCIVDHLGISEPPVPLERIAEAVGIVEIVGRNTDSFEGVLVTDNAKSRGFIAYNESSRPERRRFTIAHEIGHFLMPFHGPKAQCAKVDLSVLKAKDPNRAREAEANRFAAALLMPLRLFKSDMRRLGPPETEHIVALASRYGVSKEATARRYTELSQHACAIVFAHDGRVRSTPCRTTDFPFLAVERNHPLPTGSASTRARAEQGQVSAWSEVPAEVWLGPERRLRGKILQEQFLQQANGHRLIMLTLDDVLEDPEEDETLEESWTPRFRRR